MLRICAVVSLGSAVVPVVEIEIASVDVRQVVTGLVTFVVVAVVLRQLSIALMFHRPAVTAGTCSTGHGHQSGRG